MITFKNISKSYPNNANFKIQDISLTVDEGETLVLLGSSGSGKSTLLKMITRIIQPSEGEIYLNDKNIQEIAPTELRRSIGYVFQGTSLFPHMTVERNVAISLELMKVPKKERCKQAKESLELVNLDPAQFAKRYPHELSGGQQQRVGVARALITNPEFLLMDEPFGALDAITRNALQEEILRLNSRLKKTIVFVTHDISEAFRLADRIAVLHKGELQQLGTKDDLIDHPATEFVKDLIENHFIQREKH